MTHETALRPADVAEEDLVETWQCADPNVSVPSLKELREQWPNDSIEILRLRLAASVLDFGDPVPGEKRESFTPTTERPPYPPPLPGKERKTTTLYIMKCGKSIKIGRGNDPELRRDTLQIGCPHPIKILAVFENRGAEEKPLHRRFDPHRGIGEWFRIEGAVKEWIEGGFQ